MKTVFNNDETMHIYASQSQTEGRNSTGSIFFWNDVIYSYGKHFPMARYYKKERTFLLTNRTYSVTTSQHLSTLHMALRGNGAIFEVDNVLADTKQEHRENYKKLVNNFDSVIERSVRARKHKNFHLSCAKQLLEILNNYSKTFKLGYKTKVFTFDESAIKAQIKKENDLKRAENKRKLKDAKKALLAWKNGEFTREHSSKVRLHDFPVMLRLNGDNVETSHGAKFPASHCPIVWRMVSKCVTNKTEWRANGHTLKLGYYNVNRISKVGTLVAGCHTVKYSEILDIATQLKLTIEV